jgi:formylglycine-generating enzyme required for sulfatase activity
LKGQAKGRLEALWAAVEKPAKGQESRRLRAAAALAKFDRDNPRWRDACGPVAGDLVRENPIFLGQWSAALRDVKRWLIPRLSEILRDDRLEPEHVAERGLATNLLADYAADQPEVLADLLLSTDAPQFASLYPVFARQAEHGLPFLQAELAKTFPPDLPSSCDEREILAKRQANAAVALLRLNQPEQVWPMLKHSPDPRVRSYLIHRFGPLGASPEAVIKHLDEETDVTIQRALVQCLGEFSGDLMTLEDRQALLPKLQKMYREHPDAGLHASVEWLLRVWKGDAWLRQVNGDWAKKKAERDQREAAIRAYFASEKGKASPRWYVNGQGQTMVVIPGPVEFLMGSPDTEVGRFNVERQHKKRIGRSFALAAHSVTLEQYRRLAEGYGESFPDIYKRHLDLPAVAVNWFMAAAYCNWLSEQEGIADDQKCYEITGGETKLKGNYLSLSGYRLPTVAEMEYATRAGASTSRYYGETDALLVNYAWYNRNSEEKPWPVGRKKPNDFGLFDVQGNVYVWCEGRYRDDPTNKGVSDDAETNTAITPTNNRPLCGGSFSNLAAIVRSANRNGNTPENIIFDVGFRPARTFIR